MARTVSELNVPITSDIRDLSRNLRTASSRLTAFQREVGGIGRAIGVSLGGAAFVGAVKSGIDTIAQFELSMSKVKAISGATGAEFADLQDNARELGRSTQFTASQVAGLQLEYSKLGFSTQEILNSTEATLSLATATGEDLAQSAAIAGTTLRGFNLDAEEMTRVVDVMAASFTSSALDLDKFSNSMKFVAPVARAAGISLEETAGFLSVLADAGVSGTQAGTALRRIFTDMAKTGKPAKEALAELSEKGLTLTDAFDEVGRTAQTALLLITENSDKADMLADAYDNAAGAADAMASTVEDNLVGDLRKLGSAFEGLVLEGGALSDLFRGLTQTWTEMITAFNANELSIFDVLAPGLSFLDRLDKKFLAIADSRNKALGANSSLNPFAEFAPDAVGANVFQFGSNKPKVEKDDPGIGNLKNPFIDVDPGLNAFLASLKDSDFMTLTEEVDRFMATVNESNESLAEQAMAFEQAGMVSDQYKERMAELVAIGEQTRDQLNAAVEGIISGGIVQMSAAIGELIATGGDFKDFAKSMVSIFLDMGQQIGQVMIGLGVSMTALASAFSNPITAGPALITAGALLTAATSAIKGAIGGGGGAGADIGTSNGESLRGFATVAGGQSGSQSLSGTLRISTGPGGLIGEIDAQGKRDGVVRGAG